MISERIGFQSAKAPFSGERNVAGKARLAALIFGLLAFSCDLRWEFSFVLHGWGVFLILIPGVLLVVSYAGGLRAGPCYACWRRGWALALYGAGHLFRFAGTV